MKQFGAVKAHGILLFVLAFLSRSLSAAPMVGSVTPQPGFVNELGSVAVVFSEAVTGVRAVDFLVNGVPAESVTGTGATYSFAFPQPPYGPVDISWGTLHTITSLSNPPEPFDGGASGSTWAYQLFATNGPSVTTALPVPGSVLRRLGAVEVSFSRPVLGVDAADLRVNGLPATNVLGVGAGPYHFLFPEVASGEVTISWTSNHGIATDEEVSVPFAGFPWKYQVDTTRPAPKVVINEIMAENQTGIVDEEKDPEDWIELSNQGTEPVDLGGWSLSVDREEDGQWVFPPTTLLPGQFLVVWASGKDRPHPTGSNRAHTNFKLNPTGDTLILYGPELPRIPVDELEYPEQAPNYSYGRRIENVQLVSAYLAKATPGQSNNTASVAGKVDEVHFSVERGFFNAPFSLNLACRTSGAEIRYTLDGSPPSPTNGIVFSAPIAISATKIVRAAAFAPDHLPSRVRTHTYLMNLANNRRYLPVLSLVTATNNLYGRTGIMEFNPRNTDKHGSAWERPVSVELIRPEDDGGFQLDAGIRVAGGDYIRGLYNYKSSSLPQGKYSFRLYFRGDYGPGRLNYRFFPESTVESFNSLHIRAGMNDPSNPFIIDEFVRELSLETGLVACHGTFVYLFLNGVYKGLYNPCERVDDDFLQAYHGGGKLWDVLGPGNVALRGDGTAWSQLRTAARKDLTNKTNYLDVAARMDLPNFVDYLLPLLWADDDDWPHNNTRAAREKIAGSKFRFYPWDAEFAFTHHTATYDTIANTLSSLSPPWGTTDYQAMFNSLKKSAEFKLLFADRVHRAFFNGGPLTDEKIRARYNLVKGQAAPSISGFDNQISTWITNRRRYITNAFARAGFLASSNAPVASQFGGRVPAGYALTLRNLNGRIYYTTNGDDPRVAFTNIPGDSALEYKEPIIIAAPLHLRARSLDGTSWSAAIDMDFEVTQIGSPVRITEIMYNPPGGDAFEFIELKNTSTLPADVSGFSFNGINFRFPTPFPEIPAGGIILLTSDARPSDFRARYPSTAVSGWFGGSLANGGERIELIDATGKIVTSVDFQDHYPWPAQADGTGASLEVIDPLGNPDDPANWQASAAGGTPGNENGPPTAPKVRINELFAGVDRDWVELYNPSPTPVSIEGWSLTDNSNPRQHVFPHGSTIPASGYYQIQCDETATPGGSTAPFALDRDGETISLYDAQTNRIDVITYGPVVDGFTIGWVDGKLILCEPTVAATNRAATLGSLTEVRVNEFLANPESGDDWVELHNIGTNAVALQGCSIMTSNALAQIAAPTFIAPGGFTVLRADENPGPNHLDLKLPASGGFIALLAPSGEELDRVTYGAQRTEITMGRLPDGIGAFQELPYSPTRGTSNYLADLGSRLRITEVMAHSPSLQDWVEIQNVSTQTISLASYTFGVKDLGAPLVRWPFDSSIQIEPGAYIVLSFGMIPTPMFDPKPKFSILETRLNDNGSELTIRDPHDRIVDRVEYGFQIPGRSIGRVNGLWALLDQPSPGQANGGTALLDNGAGLRLNEWLAGGQGTNDFVEIYNPTVLPVHLGGWVLTDDPSIYGSTNNRIGSLNFIDAGGFLRFRTDGEAGDGFDHTAFRLDNLGETIRLLNPTGQVVDTIDFGVQAESVSEGRYPDGGTQIVKFPGSATPGAPNALANSDSDNDGMDDAWEIANGLNPNNPTDASLDADQDGMSNLREFLSGTDPRDAASVFQIEISQEKTGQPSIHFIAQRLRAYRVEYVDELGGSSWKVLEEISASDTTRQIAIPDSTALKQKRFYRVLIAQ